MKYKVPIIIKIDIEVDASSIDHAKSVAEDSFDCETYIDKLEENVKIGTPFLSNSQPEEDYYDEDLEESSEDKFGYGWGYSEEDDE